MRSQDGCYRPAQALHADNIAHLLQLSLGLSAWKSYGGNLHPHRGRPDLPGSAGLPAGVRHYWSAARRDAPRIWPRRDEQEGWRGDRYRAFHDWPSRRNHATAAGFTKLPRYRRPTRRRGS